MTAETTADTPRSDAPSLRSVTIELLGGILLTAVVYFEFWHGSMPSVPASVPLFVAVVGGGALGAVGIFVDNRIRTRIRRRTGVLLFVVALLLTIALFPNGLPVVVEVGLLAFGWGNALAAIFVGRSSG